MKLLYPDFHHVLSKVVRVGTNSLHFSQKTVLKSSPIFFLTLTYRDMYMYMYMLLDFW